ncbi:sulfotransferase [Rhodoblastus acidophilus]|uniref:Sulfotransferase n=1 Tax=Candidatus Rhodoblastus alkanivorans TaxID=2954117 RepID=A0ABS9Z9F7_9HYPH|nr:sulfotransferase [Candidatus Rhodoblastus alkanivorans]MCI4679681.1 sulfotransferase [Candidatus Rhodoblastus alkanivorans]MCI4683257.1 sulfotransferase [Candidatus Rhodoblastus alkanivorans]MDI4640569.1 sulfotransferase [Rhodoblastus acidophilus]
MAKYPLFIVGSPRSGTSALAGGALSAGYEGFFEGNFLPLLTTLKLSIDRHFATFGHDGPDVLASVVDRQRLSQDIAKIFREILERHNPAPPWFDKSGNPEMTAAIPTLLDLWPGSVFIFAKRRGLENVVSRLRKFPSYGIEAHCRSWANNMKSWREARERLAQEQYLEIDQQELIRDPEAVTKKMAGLLDLTEAQAAAATNFFRQRRPQETEPGTAQRVLALGDLWDDAGRNAFESICGPEMKAFGYSFGAAYWDGAR